LNFSNNILLYQDKPKYGLLLKLVLIIPAAFLVASIFLWLSGEIDGGIALFIEAIIVGLIFWFVFPRAYQVYEDHLRIVMGSPFSVKVRFQKIKTIRVTNRNSLTINFATKITQNYVEIAKKNGLSIAITPSDNDSFVENANQALNRWREMNDGQKQYRKPNS
jgi:hypothetical protein